MNQLESPTFSTVLDVLPNKSDPLYLKPALIPQLHTLVLK